MYMFVFPPFLSQVFQNMKLLLINKKTTKLEKIFNIFVHAVEDARGGRCHGGFGGGPRVEAGLYLNGREAVERLDEGR
jgi:hypothetical protein